jgi:hypothetical protein
MARRQRLLSRLRIALYGFVTVRLRERSARSRNQQRKHTLSKLPQ